MGDSASCPYKLPFQRSIFHPMRSEMLPEFLLHHRFVIGSVADVHLRHRVAFENDQMRADAVEELAITVRNQ